MKIALLGYGKMGQLVEEIAMQRGHTIVSIIKKNDPLQQGLKDAEMCIDFSHPECVLEHIKVASQLKKNLVVGTTGWYDHLNDVKKMAFEKSIGLLYSPNFSIGVNVFLKIVSEAAKLMNLYDEYDVGLIELHHNKKVDSPSGTAISIANQLVKNIKRKKNIVNNLSEEQISIEDLNIASLRCGKIPGTHTVLFDSTADTIKLTHEARSREGFALGAVSAAEWLQGKKGVFTMDDLLGGL